MPRPHIAVLLLALGLFVLLGALPAPAQDAQRVYEQAKADYQWLIKQKGARKVYHNWQSLAERFGRVFTANPNGPLAPGSLWWGARVHRDAWHEFKKERDFRDALDLYQRLTLRFPSDKLADDAQMQAAMLLEDNGQTKEAYLEYLKLTANFPQGDMAAGAKKRLDDLEKVLAIKPAGKRQAEVEAVEEDVTGVAISPPALANAHHSALATVSELRHWSTEKYTRVVVSLERAVPYNLGLLKKNVSAQKPRRLYLDLQGATLTSKLDDTVPIGDGLLQRVRLGQFTPSAVRVVVDIKRLAHYKVFTLDNPFRVVIDCFGDKEGQPSASDSKTASAPNPRQEYRRAQKDGRKVPRGQAQEQPDAMGLAAQLGLGIKRVVLDPGHGGKDPGAFWQGLKEKDITLDVAKRLKPKLERLLGCEVLLTRSSDRFLALEERTAYANTKDADLFVSIHVNAAASNNLSGVETYFLNLATDKESMRVAARENAVTTKSINDLQVILNDLMLNSKINESNRLARLVHDRTLGQLRTKYEVRDLKVKQAPFYVLIGAQMPAVLVEVGFVTNPTEHTRLASDHYRDHLATGIASGIVAYAQDLKKAQTAYLRQ